MFGTCDQYLLSTRSNPSLSLTSGCKLNSLKDIPSHTFFSLPDCEHVFCTSHQPLPPGPSSTGAQFRLSQPVLSTLPLQGPLSSSWSDPYTSRAQHPVEKSSCQWILPCCPPWGKKKIKGNGTYCDILTRGEVGKEGIWRKRKIKKMKDRKLWLPMGVGRCDSQSETLGSFYKLYSSLQILIF